MTNNPVSLGDKEKRLASIKDILDRQGATLSKDEVEEYFKEWVAIADGIQNEYEQACARVNWGSFIAEHNPLLSIELALKARELSAAAEIERGVENTLAIAYLGLGDAVRSKQHRARAILLNKSDEPTYSGIMAGMRYGETSLAGKQYSIDLSLAGPLDEWLRTKPDARISLADLRPSFGDFVSNDQRFYREATERLNMLSRRLKARLSKPDNYVLLADPGSGKSFFVKQFRSELARHLRADRPGYEIAYLERNLSAYRSVSSWI
jgi:hypothetical protein